MGKDGVLVPACSCGWWQGWWQAAGVPGRHTQGMAERPGSSLPARWRLFPAGDRTLSRMKAKLQPSPDLSAVCPELQVCFPDLPSLP